MRCLGQKIRSHFFPGLPWVSSFCCLMLAPCHYSQYGRIDRHVANLPTQLLPQWVKHIASPAASITRTHWQVVSASTDPFVPSSVLAAFDAACPLLSWRGQRAGRATRPHHPQEEVNHVSVVS